MKNKSFFGGLSAILLVIAAYFGFHVNTPTTPAPPVPDSAVVVAPVPDTTPPAPPVQVPETTVTPPPVVTPPVTTPPPPPASGSYRALLADSVPYKSTAELQKKVGSLYVDGPNRTLAIVDTVIKYHGHNTIGYVQQAGSNALPEMWVSFPGTKHIWVRAHVRFSPGWTTVGTGYTQGDGGTQVVSSAAYKMLGFGYAGYDGSGRFEITNTSQRQLYWGVVSRTKGTVAANQFAIGGNMGSEWTDGQFYTYIVEVDFTGGKQGVARLWTGLDGTTPVLRATSTSTTSEAVLPNISSFNFGMNYNQFRTGKPQQQLNYGDWEIVDGTKYADPFGVK